MVSVAALLWESPNRHSRPILTLLLDSPLAMRALQLSPSGASWAVSWGQLDALVVVPEVVAVPKAAVPEVAVASWAAPLPVVSLLGPSEAPWGYQVVASLSAAATEATAATPWVEKEGASARSLLQLSPSLLAVL